MHQFAWNWFLIKQRVAKINQKQATTRTKMIAKGMRQMMKNWWAKQKQQKQMMLEKPVVADKQNAVRDGRAQETVEAPKSSLCYALEQMGANKLRVEIIYFLLALDRVIPGGSNETDGGVWKTSWRPVTPKHPVAAAKNLLTIAKNLKSLAIPGDSLESKFVPALCHSNEAKRPVQSEPC